MNKALIEDATNNPATWKEQPFADAQATLRRSQGREIGDDAGRDPLPDLGKRSRHTALWVLATVVAGVAAMWVGVKYAKAAEPDQVAGPRWQMWAAKPGRDWEPVRGRNGEVWNFVSGSACNVDIVSVARGLPDGSLVACRRFDVKAVQR